MQQLHQQIMDMLHKNNLDLKDVGELPYDIMQLINEYAGKDGIDAAKGIMFAKETMKEGSKCPVCEQNVKMYWKKIDSMMAYYLIKLHRVASNNPERTYFHVEDDLGVPLKVGGSWAKLRWWGLIQEQPKDKTVTTKRTSGMWMLTQKGEDFVKDRISVKKYVKLYNGGIHGTDGDEVTIKQCLKDSFDFQELMTCPIENLD